MPQDVDPGAVKQIQRCLGLDGPQVEIEIRGLGLAVALPESDQVWRDNVEIPGQFVQDEPPVAQRGCARPGAVNQKQRLSASSLPIGHAQSVEGGLLSVHCLLRYPRSVFLLEIGLGYQRCPFAVFSVDVLPGIGQLGPHRGFTQAGEPFCVGRIRINGLHRGGQ